MSETGPKKFPTLGLPSPSDCSVVILSTPLEFSSFYFIFKIVFMSLVDDFFLNAF